MSGTNAFEDKILGLYLTNAAAANIGDASGLQPAATAGNLHCSLDTADPGETGDQTTNKTVYTNYARQAIARSTAGWTVASGVGDNNNAITFPQCGATGATLTHFALGFAASGAGSRDLNGALGSSLAVTNGVTPSFAAGTLDVSLD